eukprot:887353-Rhodomonas_salina.1
MDAPDCTQPQEPRPDLRPGTVPQHHVSTTESMGLRVGGRAYLVVKRVPILYHDLCTAGWGVSTGHSVARA